LTPFDSILGEIAPLRFPAIQAGLANAGHDPRDRDAFVLIREVVELLRDLSPEPGVGEGVKELVAFVHACYLFWLDGRRVVTIERDSLVRLLQDRSRSGAGGDPAGPSYYLQLPPRRIWGVPVAGAPAEPLDGCFVAPSGRGAAIVAVFGLHPGRPGLTIVEAGGPRPGRLVRDDGSPPFSPRLDGGAAAGLLELIGEAELVELVHRVHGLLGPAGAGPGTVSVSVG
jgi:hypothetical protein